MKQAAISIHTAPRARINPELGEVLIGLSINLRPELITWTEEPTDPNDRHFYFAHNNDLRQALTIRDGINAAANWFAHLELGRVTRIERSCCTLTTPILTTKGV